MSNKLTPQSTNPKDRIGANKPPLNLIPPAALIHLAQAMKCGAQKYGPFNWRDESVSASIYIGAALRHLARYQDGETHDPESGADHRAHAMACLAILLDADSVGKLVDDRPTPGRASELIEKFTVKSPPTGADMGPLTGYRFAAEIVDTKGGWSTPWDVRIPGCYLYNGIGGPRWAVRKSRHDKFGCYESYDAALAPLPPGTELSTVESPVARSGFGYHSCGTGPESSCVMCQAQKIADRAPAADPDPKVAEIVNAAKDYFTELVRERRIEKPDDIRKPALRRLADALEFQGASFAPEYPKFWRHKDAKAWPITDYVQQNSEREFVSYTKQGNVLDLYAQFKSCLDGIKDGTWRQIPDPRPADVQDNEADVHQEPPRYAYRINPRTSIYYRIRGESIEFFSPVSKKWNNSFVYQTIDELDHFGIVSPDDLRKAGIPE